MLGVSVRKRPEWDDRSVTIVITAHNEGTLIAKCVESCVRALRAAEGYTSASEILLVCDRANPKTLEIADLLYDRGRVKRWQATDFGDPGMARNAGVQEARGHYVLFVDGDDLVSESYIKGMMLRAPRLQTGFLRPEIVVTFGDEKAFLLQFDSRLISNQEVMIYSNPWAMPVFGRRDDFIALPFEGDDKANGFSHEDWEWNLRALQAGYHFETVEDAIYFARRRRGSRTAEARAFQYVIRPMDFYRNKDNFSAAPAAEIDLNAQFKKRFIGKINAGSYYRSDPYYIRDFRQRKAHSALDHFLRIGKRQGAEMVKLLEDDPVWKFAASATIESMIMLSDLEGALDPLGYWDSNVSHYDVFIRDRNTTLWRDVLQTGIFGRVWDVVFVLPWIRKGGADLVALKHIRACAEAGLNACIITTLDNDIEWADRLPEGVDILPFGKMAKNVSPIIALEVFHRLLVELRPKAIHNINSQMLWQVLERNGLSIRSNTKVICSLYCQDFNHAGASVGYDRYIDVCDPFVDAYVTDNTVYADHLSEMLGVSPEKIVTVRYPVEAGFVNAQKTSYERKRRVLWASRLDYQKGADILNQVAARVDSVEFHFYGEVMLDLFAMEDVMLPPGQVYRGKFNHVEEINPDEFDCFLYTARWDGLPNIVLEMGMKGLPIVSFVTGGLGDVINDDTAWPVQEVSPQAVIQALKSFYADETFGRNRADAMRALLSEAHNHDIFLSQCRALYGR